MIQPHKGVQYSKKYSSKMPKISQNRCVQSNPQDLVTCMGDCEIYFGLYLGDSQINWKSWQGWESPSEICILQKLSLISNHFKFLDTSISLVNLFHCTTVTIFVLLNNNVRKLFWFHEETLMFNLQKECSRLKSCKR